ERKAFIARVARHGTSASSGEEGTFGEKTTGAQPVDFSVGVSSDSAAAFCWAPPPPDPPTLPANLGERIRAAAPGALADALPRVHRLVPGTQRGGHPPLHFSRSTSSRPPITGTMPLPSTSRHGARARCDRPLRQPLRRR